MYCTTFPETPSSMTATGTMLQSTFYDNDGDSRLSMYVDNGLDTTKENVFLFTNGNTLRFGNSVYPQNGNDFQGQLDEVRIWNTVLTEAEIATIKNYSVNSSNLDIVEYFSMNEGNGLTTVNTVNSQAQASLVNGTAWVPSTAPINSGEHIPGHPMAKSLN